MLSSATLKSIAKLPGLDDNRFVHSLPPFADENNKALSAKISEIEATLTRLSTQAEDNSTRAASMLQHMKNVKQELSHTQGLYDAKNRQIETEEHLKQLADREVGRLVSEIKRYSTDLSTTTDQLNALQNAIYQGNEKIEAIRTELKLEAEELQEWLRVQTEKDEDNMALMKYTKEDDSKIKELTLSTQKLMTEVSKKKAMLSTEVTETQVAQIELEKTTEAFKQLHRERQELIHQWEVSVAAMKKRDNDIEEAQNEYQNQKEEVRETMKAIKERQQFLDQQLEQNAETEKKIGLTERSVNKIRQEQTDAMNSLQQYRDEIEVARNTLNRSAAELSTKKSELGNLKGDLRDRQQKLEQGRSSYDELKKKLHLLDDETITMDAKAAQLQKLLHEEELKDKDLDKAIKALRETQFKKSQELFKLRQEEKNLAAEITGGEAALKNLKAKCHRLDQEALKQRAMIYSMDFQIQQLERKVRRAQGDRSDEEKQQLLKRIEELNQALEASTAKYNLLNNQFKRSQEDLRHARRHLENIQKAKDALQTNIDELNMYNESASYQLEAKIKEKEELMVEENILRLELKKLRRFLNARADEVFTLESRQVQLQLGLEERAKEIEIHKDIMRIQLKNAEEERHSASSELRERVGKVEKLKKRYEILMTQFAPEEGEEEHSQAYYVIKAAQKREELQREGDELDANIRRAEKEIKALENTLKLMSGRNEAFRMNLYRAELDSNDLQHREMLEAEYRQAMANYKAKREMIQDLQQKLQDLERELASISGEESNKLQSVRELEAKIAALERDIQEQNVKRDRATKLIEKGSRTLRSGKQIAPGDMTPEETDFTIRKTKEIGTVILTELSKMKLKYGDLSGPLQQALEQYDISPPSRALSRVSSRAGSVRDDLSESGSVRGSISQLKSIRRSLEMPRAVSKTDMSDASGLPPRPNTYQKQAEEHGSRQLQNVVSSRTQSRSSALNGNDSQSGSRAHSRTQSGASTPQNNESGTPKMMSTTNLNDLISLPGPGQSRTGSSSSLRGNSVKGSREKVAGDVSPKSRGRITGSGRIKQPARPGSASSQSSQGSRASNR